MSDNRKAHARSVPYELDLEERLADPGFARAYDELEPEFQITRQIILLRNHMNMTQTELAKRAGTRQPNIARIESKGQIATLRLLSRVAKALDARLEIKLVPVKRARAVGANRSVEKTALKAGPKAAGRHINRPAVKRQSRSKTLRA